MHARSIIMCTFAPILWPYASYRNIKNIHIMKKLFLLISVFTLSLAVNAATININTETADALRLALNSANDGDEIVMAAGTYVESPAGYIAFAAKHVTVKAAEDADVLIQPKVSITITEGGCAHFKNVKIDASHLLDIKDYYSHLIYAADNNESNSMILDGCEIYGYPQNNSLLCCSSSNRLASVTITNCYFHDIMKSCLFIESTAAINISISNSTFADIETTAGSYSAGILDSRATSGSFSVDHCTFYNCQVMSTDYGTIGKVKLASGAVVSNCIFSMPTSTDNLRTIHMESGNANNCLMYNYTYDDGYGVRSNVTKNNKCIKGRNPLFVDAENGIFTLHNASPARGKGTSSTDLGDPRWASAISTITIPATLQPVDATLSDSAGVVLGTPDVINFKVIGKYKFISTEWAKWKVKVTKAGYYKFTVNATSTNGQKYNIYVLSSDESTTKGSKEGSSDLGKGERSFSTDAIDLPVGEYVVKVTNPYEYSEGCVINMVASYEGGTVTEIPGYLKAEDAVLVATKLYRDENNYIHYGDNGTPENEYVYWKIHASAAYSGKVILDLPATTSGHLFHVELYSDLAEEKLSEAYETSVSYSGGLKELSQTFEIASSGNYYLKVVNSTPYSTASLRSISIAPSLASTIDEAEDDINDVIHPADGSVYNVQLTRSFTAGMYNTICLPFAVNESEMNRVFPGAKVQELTSSSIEDGGFVLNLEFTEVNTLEAGKPYLIWPAANVANPKFLGVKISDDLNNSETTNADFIGNFVQGTISASEDNLFLGADNTLYFPTTDVTIKGMRAYFHVKNPSGPSLIRSARIVTNEEETTDIDIVTLDNETSGTAVRKVLQDGQLYIIRDNAIFNVQGQRVK